MALGRLGLIGGRDNKRRSGVYSLDEHISRENAKTYLTSFSYDDKFNALTQAGAAQGFAFNKDGTILLVCTPGTRTTAKITEWSLSTPFDITTATYQTGRDFLCGDYDLNVNSIFTQRQSGNDYVYFGGLTNDTIWSCSYNYSPGPCVIPFVSKFYLGTQDATPRSTLFGNSGYSLYTLGGTNRNVYQYSLSSQSDITTASYTSKTLAVTQDTTPQCIRFKGNGTKMYMLGSTSRALFSYTLPTPWDLTGATSDYSAPLSYQTSAQATAPRSVFVGDNGTKMYVLSVVTGTPNVVVVYQYTLSTPYNPATAVYSPAKSLNVSTRDSEAWEIFFKSDGTKMYLLGGTSLAIYSYTLSTPWDVSTGTSDYTSRSYTVTTQAAEPYNTYIGDNGTKMYVLNQATNAVFQYTLSTPYNVTTATYASKTFSVATQETNARGMYFKSDGTKMYIIGVTNNVVFSYTLATPWDISTGTADYTAKSYLYSTQTATSNDLFIGDNGTKLYVLSGGAATTDTVFQYTLGTAWDITSATYANKSFSVNTQSSVSEGIFFKTDGTKMYVLNNGLDIIYQYSLSTPWDVSTAVYDNLSFNVTDQEGNPVGMYISPDGVNMYVYGQAGDDINQYTLGTPWAINTASFVRNTSALPETTPQGIVFKSDGTKVYVVGNTSQVIYEYSLSTPWDVSTISLSRTLAIGAFDTVPRGLVFRDDGSKLFVLGDTGDRVHEFSMSIPWQLGITGRFSALAEDTTCNALYLSPDGTRMYIAGQTGDDINQYSLSTAWDIATAQFVRVSATHGEATAAGLFFKSDGTKMYVVGSTLDTVREFTLSTPWDVSTIVLSKSRYVGNFDIIPTGIYISPDGLRMYITGSFNNTIYQFDLSQAWSATYIVGYYYVGIEDSGATGMYISPDGLNLYMTGNTGDDVNQYLLDVAWDISTTNYVRVSAAIGETEPRGLYFSNDGTKMIVTGQTNDEFRQFSLSTPWNVSTATLYDTFYHGHIGGSVTCVHFSPDGLYMYFINGTLVYRFTLAQAFESNKVIGTYCVSKEETVPTAFDLVQDSTIFLTGQTGDDVNVYYFTNVGSPISELSFGGVSPTHGEATATGIAYAGSDATYNYIYITGTTLKTIRRLRYSGGDISTLSFLDSASIAFEATPSGLTCDIALLLTGTTNDCIYRMQDPFSSGVFYTNGTSGYAYIGGSEANVRSLSIPSTTWEGTLFTGGSAIRKYTSSYTPHVESITLSQTFAITEPYGIHVTPNGKRIYIALGTTAADKGGRAIRVINMTTPFDLSTATLDAVEAIGAPGLLGNAANLWNIYVMPDEMKMFVMSPTVQGIYQFSRRFA